MTVAEILENEEVRQHEFPLPRERIFPAHSGACPLPRRVAEAIGRYAPTLSALTAGGRPRTTSYQ